MRAPVSDLGQGAGSLFANEQSDFFSDQFEQIPAVPPQGSNQELANLLSEPSHASNKHSNQEIPMGEITQQVSCDVRTELCLFSSVAAAVHDSGRGQLSGGTGHTRCPPRGLRHSCGPLSPAAEVPRGPHSGDGGWEGLVPPDAGEVLQEIQRPVQQVPESRGVEAVGRDREQLHHRVLERGPRYSHHVRTPGGVLPAVRTTRGETDS